MTANSQQHQAELHKKLWDMANSLRGQMEASEFKNYILGVIFYRFLSEKVEEEAELILKNDPGQTYESLWKNHVEFRDQLVGTFVDSLGYAIKPEHLFSRFIKDINDGNFSVTTLQEAINELNSSTVGSETQDSFDHLFDDLDLTSSKLGKNVSDRSALMGRIIQHVNDIPFKFDDVELDLLGTAYEYLISKFAMTAGKSAGEFYTPQQVSKILAKIVAGDKKQLNSVYDPTCGSGSLLLRIARETKVHNYYGQELTSSTYNLARMNMMLHGVSHEDFDFKNDNTLTKPQHLGQKFEAIVANPPYSAHWNPSAEMSNDPRFSEYGKLAPKTKADFAFVQHMIHHLDDNGTMAVVLPHGVLFRGAAEGVIRKQLIEKNYLDAVIGLPVNIFYGTSIPTCILVFKKCREDNEKVLFIDASNEFEKGKNSNSLSDSNVKKIVEAYSERKTEDKFSRSVPLKEIKENDYNLNIPRYVDSSEAEELVDIALVSDALDVNKSQIEAVEARFSRLLGTLRYTNPVELYAKKLYSLILESAPTLQGVALIYSKSGWDVMTHDGKKVESHAYESYPIQMKAMDKVTIDLLNYLKVETFAILLTANREASIFTHNDLEAIVWTNINDFFNEAGKTDDEKWKILETSHHSAFSLQKINL